MPSRELRRRVEDYLRERAANVAVFPRHVRVIGPAFVEIALSAELFPLRPGLAPKAEGTALARLRGYLHPLTGGPAGRGWEFGRLPCLSDFFSLLEGIEELDHVGSLAMTLQPVSPQGIPLGGALRVTPADAPTLSLPGYALVASGDHQLTSRIGS